MCLFNRNWVIIQSFKSPQIRHRCRSCCAANQHWEPLVFSGYRRWPLNSLVYQHSEHAQKHQRRRQRRVVSWHVQPHLGDRDRDSVTHGARRDNSKQYIHTSKTFNVLVGNTSLYISPYSNVLASIWKLTLSATVTCKWFLDNQYGNAL